MRRRDAALGDHDQPVADLEQLVEFLADDQQRAAGVAQREQFAADQRRGADIDAPGRLRDDQQLRLRVDLAADDELLQVAARQALRRRAGAAGLDLEALDDAGRPAPRTRRGVDPAAAPTPPRCASAACSAPGSASAPRRGRAVPRERSAGRARRRRRGEWRADVGWPNERDRCRAPRAGPRPTARPSAPAGRCPRRRRCRRSRRRAPRSRCRSGRRRTGPAAAATGRRTAQHRRAGCAGLCAAAAAARRRSSAATGWRCLLARVDLAGDACRRAARCSGGTARGSRRACG